MRPVVFIHGAFMSAESWDPWKQRFEGRGYRCVAPAWPFLDQGVEELQRSPDPRFGKLGITKIVENYASIIRALEMPPVLVGHSFGGLSSSCCSTAASARPASRSIPPRRRAFCRA